MACIRLIWVRVFRLNYLNGKANSVDRSLYVLSKGKIGCLTVSIFVAHLINCISFGNLDIFVMQLSLSS